MKLSIQTGTTNKTVQMFIQDVAALNGGGLVANTGNLSCWYSAVETDNSLATGVIALQTLPHVTGDHIDGGIIAVKPNTMPGLYRLDLPDLLWSSNNESVVVIVTDSGGSGVTTPMEFEMVGDDPLTAALTTADVASAVWDSLLVDHSVTDSFSNYIYDIDAGIDSLATDIANVPTVAEFNARTILSADYFDPAVDTVATVTTVTNMASSGDIAEAVWSLDVNAFGFSSPQAGGLQLEINDNGTAIADIPTVAEFNARTIPSGDYLTAANVWDYDLNGYIGGATSAGEMQYDTRVNVGDPSVSLASDTAALLTRTIPSGDYLTASDVWDLDMQSYGYGGGALTAGELVVQIDQQAYDNSQTLGTPNNGDIATDIYDVSELIGSPAAGDVSTDIANVQTAVNDVPTNAEFNARTIPSGDYLTANDVWSENMSTYTVADTAGALQVAASGGGSVGGTVAVSATGLDDVLIDGMPLPEAMQVMSAVLAGEITSAGTSPEIFYGLDGVTQRVAVSGDSTGNRTGVEYLNLTI